MARVFISYRHNDSAGYTGRICEHLRDHFGKDQIFIDIDPIPPGVDFVNDIQKKVQSSQSFVAVIGTQWLTMTDSAGKRKVDDPKDMTRVEIETALASNLLIIPVLVDGARMPHPDELPESLAEFSHRNALTVSNEHFDDDMQRLIVALASIIPTSAPSVASPSIQTSEHPGMDMMRNAVPMLHLSGTMCLLIGIPLLFCVGLLALVMFLEHTLTILPGGLLLLFGAIGITLVIAGITTRQSESFVK